MHNFYEKKENRFKARNATYCIQKINMKHFPFNHKSQKWKIFYTFKNKVAKIFRKITNKYILTENQGFHCIRQNVPWNYLFLFQYLHL